MEKSYPDKEGHPPSPFNFSDRLGIGHYLFIIQVIPPEIPPTPKRKIITGPLYEKKVVIAKQQLTTALAHAMILSP